MSVILDHVETLLEKPKLKMVDISSWNGVPDIPNLGAEIVAIKATEGTGYRSPVFERDWQNTKAAGKARVAYHFFHPSVSALAQARFFLDTVKNAGLEDYDALAVDFEQTDGLGAYETSQAANKFREAVESEEKCSLIVYTYIDFAKSGNCAGLGNQPLWIADPSSPAGHPNVPEPWASWTFHQWGVRRGTDQDICNFTSLETFYKFGVLPVPPPLTPDQRRIRITDGHATKDEIISIQEMTAGFTISINAATFTVVEDGLPKLVPNVDPAQAAAILGGPPV